MLQRCSVLAFTYDARVTADSQYRHDTTLCNERAKKKTQGEKVKPRSNHKTRRKSFI